MQQMVAICWLAAYMQHMQHMLAICCLAAYMYHMQHILAICWLAAYTEHMAVGALGRLGQPVRLGADRGGDPRNGQKLHSVSYRCHFLVRELEAGHFGARGPVRRPGSGVWAEGLGRRPRTSDSGPCILPYGMHNR